MSDAVFPNLHGLSWTVRKKPMFSTLIQKAAAPGHETRISLGEDPIYSLELEYTVLYAGDRGTSLAELEGFFKKRRGNFDCFLVDLAALTSNPKDGTVTGQALTVDADSYAPLVVTAGGYDEAIFQLNGAPVIKMGGVVQTLHTNYTIEGPGVAVSGATYAGLAVKFLTEVTGPITADFSWFYRVRFAESEQEFEMFHYLLWRTQKMQLVGVRA